MSQNAKLAREVCGIAIVMGILADMLLRDAPWGFNLFLWIMLLTMVLAWLASRQAPGWPDTARMVPWIAIVFALGIAWRDSLMLKGLAVVVIGATLSMPALRSTVAGIRKAGITDQIAAVIFTGLSGAAGSVFLADNADWTEMPPAGWRARVVPLLRGVLMALPILVIFAALFASADAAFAALVQDVIDVDYEWLLSHVAIIGIAAWITGGYLHGMLSGTRIPTIGENRIGRGTLGIMEIGTVLGLLAALFAVFLAVQVRYHFGGEALIQATTGLTYAEYARSGFFELLVVSALVLPILLAADWLLRSDTPGQEQLFRVLAVIELVLLFAVMASAMQRMYLYQTAYGLTALRFYATAFMIWLAVVFLWFAATVLRDRRRRFAFGVLVAGWIAAAGLFVVNPDAIIVRVNAERAEAGYEFDSEYALSLSADAVPALIEALPVLRARDRCTVAEHLLQRWGPPASGDWRTFSLSRWQAERAVLARAEELRQLRCALTKR